MLRDKKVFLINEEEFVVAQDEQELKSWYEEEFSCVLDDVDICEIKDIDDSFMTTDEDSEEDYMSLREAIVRMRNVDNTPFIVEGIRYN